MAAPIPDDARCLDCGYRLKLLTGPLCPECGRPFDPQDRRTYKCPADRGKWSRLSHPSGNWHVGLSIVLALIVLEDLSVPGGD